MVPSITYLDRPGDRIVPGICIGSEGPVASVALFTRRPIDEVRSIALDTSSRTSAMLTRILCARLFHIAPTFVPHAPELESMLAVADAALLIGDPALFLDPEAHRAIKIDLGAEWTNMTGLPFVWAFWSGRPNAADASVTTLQHVSDPFRPHPERVTADAEYARRASLLVAADVLATALVHRWVLEGTIDSDVGAVPLDRRYTNVYRREGGRWRWFARHANVVMRKVADVR
mgnify:CR=1 FL=1